MNARADLIVEYARDYAAFDLVDALFWGALALCFLLITAVVGRVLEEGP